MSTARLFNPERLPHVGRADLRASQLLAGWLAGAPRVRLRLGGIGALEAEVVRILPSPPKTEWDGPAIAIATGDRFGRIALDQEMAAALVRASVGGPRPRLIRALRGIERGVLAAIFARLLDALEIEGRLVLSRAATKATGCPAVDLAVSALGLAGCGRLEIPPEALPKLAWAHRGATALRLSAALELGRTHIARGELADAKVGDTVVFDRPKDLVLAIGEYGVPCRMGDARVELTGLFRAISQEEDTMPRGGELNAGTVLGTTPFDVTAELARVALTGDQVLGLAPGSIVDVGPMSLESITLRVAGRVWAYGELVEMDGRLAVRITALAPA